ncbi:MAG TPA: hypothetical protein VF176_00640 [Solirubrobacterales bacterium]
MVATLAYVKRRPKTRLEYFVQTNSAVLPASLPETFSLIHRDLEVTDPAIMILRIVNTGDRAITPQSFENDIVLRLTGVSEVISATCTARRPEDLEPTFLLDGECAKLKPILINPGDLMQIQLLSAGQASEVSVSGRVSELSIKRRDALPYPPGSGPHGELEGPVDYFMWFVGIPGFILGIGALIALNNHNSAVGRITAAAVALVLTLVIYPLQLRFLLRRRQVWDC